MSVFWETGTENTDHILDAFNYADNIEVFLHDQELRFPVFPCCYDWKDGLLSTTYDIDGVVLELNQLAGLKLHLPFINLPPATPNTVKNQYHFLKKHLPLSECSQAVIKAIKNIHGLCLGQTTGGYFLNVSIVPRDLQAGHHLTLTPTVAPAQAIDMFNALRAQFSRALRALEKNDMGRESVQKNHLADPSKFNLLEQDQHFILGVLDEALQMVDTLPDVRLMITLTQFGQKSPSVLDFDAMVDEDQLAAVSVHIAVNLVPKDPRLHVLWSRYGLEETVGNRGSLFPALSMGECSNFQSTLDGRAPNPGMDWKNVLLKGVEGRGTLQFLQMYTDSPHTHLSMPYKHPVSGVVTTCNLLHHEVNKAMHVRAMRYIELMEDLMVKFVRPLSCRLEAVKLFKPQQLPDILNPEHIFCDAALMKMLRDVPIIVPFVDGTDGKGILHIIRHTISYLTAMLNDNYQTRKGRGGFEAAWRCYQAELALEELIYGHPLSSFDDQLSQILGTSAVRSKSLTRQRGFLGLDDWNGATSDVCCPPLSNWTKDQRNMLRIQRIFQLAESLEAAPSAVGEKMWMVLLGDMYREPQENIPVAELKAVEPPSFANVVGANQAERFIEMVADKNIFPFPHTFDVAKKMVTQAGLDPHRCLQLGLESLKLRWFPYIRIWEQKHPRASWDRKSFIEIYTKDREAQMVSRVALVKGFVLVEMERRGLCFKKKLDKYRELGMPWLERCMLRLPDTLNPAKEKVKVLVFLSCVALLENNEYVDFKAMDKIRKELLLTMARMQELLLLSKYILQKRTPFTLWRLHETIPTRMPNPTEARLLHPPPAKKARVEDETQQDKEDVQAVDEAPEETEVKKKRVRFLPPSSRTRWSPEEMALIPLDPDIRQQQAYQTYLRACEDKHLPARTYKAFRVKRTAMMRDQ